MTLKDQVHEHQEAKEEKKEEKSEKKLAEEKEKEKEELNKQITDILKEYGRVSDIPVLHEFWALLNKLRSLG